MSIVNTLDRIAEWTQNHICDPVSFKVPPLASENKKRKSIERDLSTDDESRSDGKGYEYQRKKPLAFTWLIPSKDRMPTAEPIFPSVCVRFSDASTVRGNGTIPIELCFSVWNPGTHGSDIVSPLWDGSYEQWKDDDAKNYFERNNHLQMSRMRYRHGI